MKKAASHRNCDTKKNGGEDMLKIGGWKIGDLTECKLPQKAASVFTSATEGLTGATYTPLLFVGTQLVNGTNYCFIALQTLILATPRKRLVKMIVNESSSGKVSIVNVNSIGIKD